MHDRQVHGNVFLVVYLTHACIDWICFYTVGVYWLGISPRWFDLFLPGVGDGSDDDSAAADDVAERPGPESPIDGVLWYIHFTDPLCYDPDQQALLFYVCVFCLFWSCSRMFLATWLQVL